MKKQEGKFEIGFLGLLTLVLLTLKGLGYISISWWWVFAPVIGGAAITLLVLLGMFILFLVLER